MKKKNFIIILLYYITQILKYPTIFFLVCPYIMAKLCFISVSFILPCDFLFSGRVIITDAVGIQFYRVYHVLMY